MPRRPLADAGAPGAHCALALVAALCLVACGPDVVGAAATSATTAAAAARQAEQDKAKAQEAARAIEKAQQERTEQIDKQTDGASH